MLHYSLQRSAHSLGPIRVHLPDDLAGPGAAWEETQSPCYISQLVLFRKNPHPWGGRAPGQVQALWELGYLQAPGSEGERKQVLGLHLCIGFRRGLAWDMLPSPLRLGQLP